MEFNKNVQALIALNGLEIGLSRKHNAVSLFEQPADMFTEAEDALFELKKAVGEENALTLLKNLKSDYVSDRTKEMEKEGVFAVSYLDGEYPEIFDGVYPKPLLLYVKGNVSLLKSETVAVAGPRKPTRYAETVTYDFCTEFAKAGLTVVSGLAAGIDGTAHRAALDAGGKTVAVVANGLDVVYPAEHRGLRESILLNDGLIISEYKLKTKPNAYQFPERNRLICGLAKALFVPEAATKSGTMITLNLAAEQGKEVFITPSNINNPEASGSNKCLQQGARMALSASDVLDFYDLSLSAKSKAVQISLSEQVILDVLKQGEMHFEEILEKSEFNVNELQSILAEMEIDDLVVKSDGNFYSLR